MATKKKKTEEVPDEVVEEIPGDEEDQLGVYSETSDGILDRIHEANKAIVAAVGAIATLAISLGFGDSETWAQVTAVIVAILTVVGVFAVSNDEPA